LPHHIDGAGRSLLKGVSNSQQGENKMIYASTRRAIRLAMPVLMAAAAVAAGLAPGGSSEAYSQRRKAKAPARAATAPLSVYDQGYQKGYTEGFNAGGEDWRRGVPRDYEGSDAYARREQAYAPQHAGNAEYRQGYHLGFELGYTDGYYGRARNAAVPSNGAVLAKAAALANAQREREQQMGREPGQPSEPAPVREPAPAPEPDPREATRPRATGSINVPAGTDLQIRLNTPISTKTNRVGDRFTAVVVSPAAYQGATIDGHISTLEQSGRVSGRTEMSFAFDTITLVDGRQGPLNAELDRIIESESVKSVDEEGRVQTGSRTKDSQVRGGVGAAAGAVIGGIAGGVKGAILGAIIGGAAGVGTVYVEGNKELVLEPGTEMVIRTLRSNPR
jgi:hypothetical protein